MSEANEPSSQTKLEENGFFDENDPLKSYEAISQSTKTIIQDLHEVQNFELAISIQQVLAIAQYFKESYIAEVSMNDLLRLEVEKAAGKLSQTVKISQADHHKFEILKRDIHEAWMYARGAVNRDLETQESLVETTKKLEVDLGGKKKQQQKGLEVDELGEPMAKHKESLLTERDRLQVEVEELTKRLQLQRFYSDELEKKREAAKKKIEELIKTINDHTSERFKERRILESTQHELESLKIKDEDLQTHLEDLQKVVDDNRITMQRQERQLGVLKASNTKLTNTLSFKSAKAQKLDGDLKILEKARVELQNEASTSLKLLKLKEDESNACHQENAAMLKQKEGLMKKLMDVSNRKGALEQEILQCKNLVRTLERDLETTQRQLDQAKKHSEDVGRERDLMRKELMRTVQQVHAGKQNVSQLQEQIKVLSNGLEAQTALTRKAQFLADSLKIERDAAIESREKLVEKLDDAREVVNRTQDKLQETRKQLEEAQMQKKHLQMTLEVVRKERNVALHDLQKCSEKSLDKSTALHHTARESERIKECLKVKETEVNQLGKQLQRAMKNQQVLQAEVEACTVSLQEAKSELQDMQKRNTQLQDVITEDEVKIGKQRKHIENLTHDKDVIGTQLVRRNNEITEIREQLNTTQMALNRGESQYLNRIEDIRLLKIEISNLENKCKILKDGMSHTADMRQEVLQLNRLLTQERVKGKTLEQEMLIPTNVHRWRKLEGKDPDYLELLEKNHALQNRILCQTQTIVSREKALEDIKKQYEVLKQKALMAPTPDVRQKLCLTQRVLTGKTKKMKALAAELNCLEAELMTKDKNLDEMKELLKRVQCENIQLKNASSSGNCCGGQ